MKVKENMGEINHSGRNTYIDKQTDQMQKRPKMGAANDELQASFANLNRQT